MSEKEKSPLVPRLRFPEFREAAEWGSEKLEQLITTVSPPSKLQSSSYRTQGKFPIIDQSQELICGWTDDESAVIDESLPLIVFGDHTCALKFVEKPFAQGADGIKILKAKPSISAEYLFHSLSHRPLAMEDYKRHYSILKERAVVFPDIKSGEQHKIADCLSSLDELITAETQKLDTLKTHKKGLMQQLFPREGETVPRLRFPEFRGAGGWEVKALDQLGELVSGLTYSPDDVRDEGLLVLRSSNVQDGRIVLDDNVYVRSDIKGASPSLPNDILICVRNGSKSLIGKNALIPEDMPPCTHGAFMTVFRSGAAKFIIQLFQTEAYERQVAADLGATINSINGNQLKKYKFRVPEAKEQQVIADCLSSFDDLITAQTQKIDALKTHKKGLMQQLFPTLDEVGA
ncbi:restriction endonuclease subunit S [Klebsiella quasipneumoniae subsp. similipneumoniae]|uniref:restriction endonuclease subunit S n=1 Tax=Klebsiella quasipneumoniae TaxID=1463165 RepID=UPI0038D11BAB